MTMFDPPNHPPNHGSQGTVYTFKLVEERLVEAMRLWRRMPDRERGWQHVRALWPELKHGVENRNVGGEISQREATAEPPKTRRPAPTRDQIAEMEEAGEWLGLVAERDRRLVALALAAKAGGREAVPWQALWERLGRGRPGPRGLQQRYDRAIAGVAMRLNGDVKTPAALASSQSCG